MQIDELARRCMAFTISCNEHRVYYDSLETYVDAAITRWEPRDPDELRARILKAGTIWEVHCYPRTPVVFFQVFEATFEAAIDEAIATLVHGEAVRALHRDAELTT